MRKLLTKYIPILGSLLGNKTFGQKLYSFWYLAGSRSIFLWPLSYISSSKRFPASLLRPNIVVVTGSYSGIVRTRELDYFLVRAYVICPRRPQICSFPRTQPRLASFSITTAPFYRDNDEINANNRTARALVRSAVSTRPPSRSYSFVRPLAACLARPVPLGPIPVCAWQQQLCMYLPTYFGRNENGFRELRQLGDDRKSLA